MLPLAFDTAACGLYSPTSEGHLGLPKPSLDPKPAGKVVCVSHQRETEDELHELTAIYRSLSGEDHPLWAL